MASVAHKMSREKETPDPLPKAGPLPGVVCIQWVPRGTDGEKYGPYYSRMWRENGRLRKQYVRPEDLEDIRARCAQYRELERAKHEASIEAMRLRVALISQNRKLEEQLGTAD